MLGFSPQMMRPFNEKGQSMSTYSFQQVTPFQDILTRYSQQLGADVAVLSRIGAAYSVNEAVPFAMAVIVGAGAAFRGGTVIEVAARTTPTINAPSSNPRIDRVVLNAQTDAILVVQGTEAATPVAPLVPTGHLPLARIALVPGMTVITNAEITDERLPIVSTDTIGGGLIGVQKFTISGTYAPTPGTNSVIVEVVGGGGSGGGCAATNGSQGSASSGGSSGSYARARLMTGFTNVPVTIGAGGATTAAAAVIGNPGAASSFGTLVTAPGGVGGYAGTAYVPPAVVGGALPGSAPTGGNLVNSLGSPSQYGSVFSVYAVVAGCGAPSVFGGAGTGGGNLPGLPAAAPGAGGGGASSILNSSARTGGAGAAGLVTVYEYG
jgi:hypothetical protein